MSQEWRECFWEEGDLSVVSYERAHEINTDAYQFRTLGFQIGKNNFSELVGAKMWLDTGWGSGDNSFKSSGSEFGGNGA